MFRRFHRGAVGRASRRRGTGLGLAIARELAARWRGTVTLANAPAAARGPRSRSRWPMARPRSKRSEVARA